MPSIHRVPDQAIDLCIRDPLPSLVPVANDRSPRRRSRGGASVVIVGPGTNITNWVRDLLAGVRVDLRLGHARYLKAISYAKVKTDADTASPRRE